MEIALQWEQNSDGDLIAVTGGFRARLSPRPGRCWWWVHDPGAVVQTAEGYAATIDQAKADATACIIRREFGVEPRNDLTRKSNLTVDDFIDKDWMPPDSPN